MSKKLLESYISLVLLEMNDPPGDLVNIDNIDNNPESDDDNENELDEISVMGGGAVAGYTLPLGMTNNPSARKRSKSIMSRKRRGPSYYLKNK